MPTSAKMICNNQSEVAFLDNTGAIQLDSRAPAKVTFKHLISGVCSEDGGGQPGRYPISLSEQVATQDLDLGGGNINETEAQEHHPRRYP